MERLRSIREQAGFSQQDLADESGVSQHTISEIELGRRKPQGRTLRKLAKALGVEVADFYGGPERPLGETPPPTQPSFNGLLEEERRTIYLRAALEEIHGKAEAARWALEDVPSFAEAREDIRPEKMLDAWSHFISELRDDARVQGRIWSVVFRQVSGQSMPAEEEGLLDELRRELAGFEDVVEQLGAKFSDEWASFRQRRTDAELAPNVHQLFPDHVPPTGDEQSRDAV